MEKKNSFDFQPDPLGDAPPGFSGLFVYRGSGDLRVYVNSSLALFG